MKRGSLSGHAIAATSYHIAMTEPETSTADVHSTAYVDPRAQLGAGVVVGPGCIIEGPVVVGAGTRLMAYVQLQAPLTLGLNNTVYPFACLGFNPQDRHFGPEDTGHGVAIGDDNVLRESVTINGGTEAATRLGSGNYLMAMSHLGHDCAVGDHNTFANGAMLAGHVHLADRVNLGGNAGVHQFCRVGRLAMIAGNEGISRDLPPFCLVRHSRRVCGLNLVGLRRAGLRDHIHPLKRAFTLLYKSGLTTPGALQRIETELADDPLCLELVHFIRASEHGITSYSDE
jgi:UDP-N-acetylglucosamine acyltransferase